MTKKSAKNVSASIDRTQNSGGAPVLLELRCCQVANVQYPPCSIVGDFFFFFSS